MAWPTPRAQRLSQEAGVTQRHQDLQAGQGTVRLPLLAEALVAVEGSVAGRVGTRSCNTKRNWLRLYGVEPRQHHRNKLLHA